MSNLGSTSSLRNVLISPHRLVYRASQVVQKPLDELAALLGFDIPLAPDINLASIKADGAIVHWFVPDKQKQKGSLKFEILLNGAVLDTVPITYTAVTISGLQPSTFYVVRVALVNNHDFGSRSPPIRFRTKPASSTDFFVPTVESHHTDHDGSTDTLPYVHQYRGLKDVVPAVVTSAPPVKEGSLGRKRSVTARRPSPAALDLDCSAEPCAFHDHVSDGHETLQHLTEKLDAIRREIEDIERQSKEEEEDEYKEKEKMIEDRDRLRAEVAEKEKANRELKRSVNVLERQNTAAQNDRSKHERLLQQKKQERHKLREDMARWDHETVEMRLDVERIRRSKLDYLHQTEQEKETLRARLAQEYASVRALDDAIREKNAEYKRIERAMKNSSPASGIEPEPNLVQQLQQDAEEERQWIAHRATMQAQYAMSFQALEAAKRFYADQQRYLDSLRAERRRAEEPAQPQISSPPPTQERLPRRGDSPRSRRAQSGNGSAESPHLAGFPINHSPLTHSAFTATLQGMPTAFPTAASPFINLQNGMTLNLAADTISDEDRERLTAGAPMSPGAGAELLPTNLFSDDGERRNPANFVQPLPGLGSLPGLPSLLGAQPSQTLHDYPAQGPVSPVSAGSRSPSVFASPRESNQMINIGSPDYTQDADRQSIRSNHSNLINNGTGAPASSRFSSMFGIKPRVKAITADDGPALGKAQSRSMPRADYGLAGIDLATRKRNSSISGPAFPPDGVSDYSAEPPATSSRRRFGLFGREKSDGWPTSFTSFGRRPTSPRPGSTHSTELPRPSVDSNRWGISVGESWPSADANGGVRNSPLGFGPGWNTPSAQQARLFGSRHPSRRPSTQYGGTTLSEHILEADDPDALYPDQEPQFAPIGTRPPPGLQKMDSQPKDAQTMLNPNAKNFKSLFAGTSRKDKRKTSTDKNATPVASTSNTPSYRQRDLDDDASPPNSRKSRDTRDTRSIATTESSLAESGRNSTELALTPSYATSADAPSPLIGSLGSMGKESLMAKITRKSSSSKFSLPNFKREKSRLLVDQASAGAPPSTPAAVTSAEEVEDGLSASLRSLRERENRASTRSWSSVMKLGKKKGGGETPSVSGLSAASGTEDGNETDEAEV